MYLNTLLFPCGTVQNSSLSRTVDNQLLVSHLIQIPKAIPAHLDRCCALPSPPCSSACAVCVRKRPQRRPKHLGSFHAALFRTCSDALFVWGCKPVFDAVEAPRCQMKEHLITNETTLTAREEEVRAFICKGFSNKQIARQLGLSDGTIKIHVGKIPLKTGLRNRTQVAARPPRP